MNEATASLWTTANAIGVGTMYNEASRNPDPAVRSAFKADREVSGTRAWAICQCMKLANPATEYTYEEAAAIVAALDA